MVTENQRVVKLHLFITPLYTEFYNHKVIICNARTPITSIFISLRLNSLLMRRLSRKPCLEFLSVTHTSSLEMSDEPDLLHNPGLFQLCLNIAMFTP